MIPSEPLLHREETGLLQVPHTPPHRALRHLQLPGHSGNRWPAHTLFVSSASQIQIDGNGSVGQLALINSFKVCHLPSPFLGLFFAGRAHWRGLWCPAVWAVQTGVAVLPFLMVSAALPALPRRFPPQEAAPASAAGMSPGWLSPRCSFRHRPQAGCLCREPCTALRK